MQKTSTLLLYLYVALLCSCTFGALAQVPTEFTAISCGNGNVTLTAVGSPPFRWYRNTPGSTVLSTSRTFVPPFPGTYYYADSEEFYRKVEVYVTAKPDSVFNSNFAICLNTPMHFEAKPDRFKFAFNGNGMNAGAEVQGEYPTRSDTSLTMEASVFWRGGSARQCILYNGSTGVNGYGLFVSAGGQLSVVAGGVSLSSTVSVTNGKWHHVAATRTADAKNKPGTWKLYLDGVPYDVTNNTTKPIQPSLAGFSVGRSSTGLESFNGKIDEVKMWFVARDIYGIATSRMDVMPVPQNGLAGYWRFDAETGQHVPDVSGNGYHLTLSDNLARAFSSGYEWNFAGTKTEGTPYPPDQIFATAGDKSVTFTVTDLVGCKSDSVKILNANNYKPPVTASASVAAACVNDKINLFASGGGIALSSDFNDNLGAGWTVSGFALEPSNTFYTTPDGSKAYLASAFGKKITDAQMISPAFSTKQLTDDKIRLSHYNAPSTLSQSAKVQLSTDKTNWTTLAEYTGTRGLPFSFAREIWSLPAAFENKDVVYIRFLYNEEYCEGWGSGWYIDNLDIYTGLGKAEFIWTSSPNYFNANVQNPVDVVHKGPTAYTVRANTGCMSDPATIIVNTNPVANAQISIKDHPVTSKDVCANDVVKIVFTGSGAQAPFTFAYKVNEGPVQTITTTSGNSVELTAPTGNAGTFAYNLLRVSGPNACSREVSEVISIMVAAKPAATLTGSQSVCQNEPAYITFKATGGRSPFTYSYQYPENPAGFITSAAAELSLQVSTAEAGIAEYILYGVRDGNGCETSYEVNGNAPVARIAVGEKPVVNVSQPPTIPPAATEFPINYWSEGIGNPNKYSVKATGPNAMPGFVAVENEFFNWGNYLVPVKIPASAAGTYNFEFSVVNSDAGCPSVYPITLEVADNDSRLSGFSVSNGPLSPAFAPGVFEYTAPDVPLSTTAISVTATVANPTSVITNGSTVIASGVPFQHNFAFPGQNHISLRVTAQDGSYTTYTIYVTQRYPLTIGGYDGDAYGAYSLRKLGVLFQHGTITPPPPVPGYTHAAQPLIRVRRATDNALLDIGFTADGVLDTLALKRFAGTSDAFVNIWYDQGGNDHDAVQNTPGSQPRIVHAGRVERKGSLPTLYFYGSTGNNVFLSTNSFVGRANGFGLFAVAGVKSDFTNNDNALVSKTLGNQPAPWDIYGSHYDVGNGAGGFDAATTTVPFTSATPFAVRTFVGRRFSAVQAYLNGSVNTTATAMAANLTDPGSPLTIGSRQDGATRLAGWISEVIYQGGGVYSNLVPLVNNQKQTYLKPFIHSFTPVMAQGNAEITITGENFTGATTVSVGNSPATISSVTAGQIKATINDGSSGEVSVTTPLGTGSKGGFYYGTPPGKTLSFDGGDDYVTIDNDSPGSFGTGDFTIEMYARTTQNTGAGSVLNKRDVCGLTSYFDFIITDGKIKFVSCENGSGLNYNSISGTTRVTDGKWHHIAVTRAGNVISLYVDDHLDIAFTTRGIADIQNNTAMKMGNNVCNNRYSGSLDELRIWNYARTPAELQAARFNVVDPKAENLLVYYNFDVTDNNGRLSDIAAASTSGTLRNFEGGSSLTESYSMVLPVARDASDFTATGFTARWAEPVVGSADRYLLDVSANEQFDSFLEGYHALPVTGTSQIVTVPSARSGRASAAGQYYYYRVRAEKTGLEGQGGSSNITTVSFNPLPVHLVSFTGTKTENASVLKWTVTNEQEFEGYEVQRSFDARTFEKIAWLDAVSNGLTAVTRYHYQDNMSGINSGSMYYYRLKMIDRDGSYAMSKVIAIDHGMGSAVIGRVYPNPVSGRDCFIDIKLETAGNWQSDILGVTGTLLRSKPLKLGEGHHRILLETRDLPSGIYLLKLRNVDSGQDVVRKMVVN
ncbi:hypothetical protein GCM10023091_36960 [Ravibacter arvi]|uniref:Laminin G domain-containing protein n=1 Tax=Ravibacter arvi TaxID=2051041 RepID=A0ABP8M7E9_9BACT